MTKFSVETKLKAIEAYQKNHLGYERIAHQFGINSSYFRRMLIAYQHHGCKIFEHPPKITAEFRIQLVQWMIRNNASYTETIAQFGYLGIVQMAQWRKIYLQAGTDGLRSVKKGKPTMPRKMPKKDLTPQEKRLAELEEENLKLRIQLAVSKKLASMEQEGTIDDWPEPSFPSRRNSDK
ncbi:helix-turn-helix domain-containing protein [Convivina intestini]|uniref:helix-turn-helix domain-containing protein n=1 Tax=Convivina intestini TaxID=1505726 RepID=UPI00200D39A2|nr:helix-turn-helix domain-containing protein [Convivina intestini]